MAGSSWWLDEDTPPPLARVQVEAPDVEIVGAGITGISAALTFAEAGLRVRVHDSRQVAGGASGRNGGFALRGGALPYDQAREWLGADLAFTYWRLTEEYLDRLAPLAGDALRRTGSLRIASDSEERDEIRAEYDALCEDGIAAEWRTDVVDGRFPAAIFHPGDAAIQPARLVRRLAARAADAGVEIVEHHRVASLDELGAPRVLVATDGYPSGLLGSLEGLIVPTRGQMIATEPVAERLFDCPHYGRHGFDYWQQLPDGRITVGGFRDFALDSEFTDSEETTETIQAALDAFVADLVGRPVPVAKRWAGIFGLVLDFLPVVGRLPGDDRTWVAGGYSGHGNVLGFLSGDLVAKAMLGEEHPLLERFAPARLPRQASASTSTSRSWPDRRGAGKRSRDSGYQPRRQLHRTRRTGAATRRAASTARSPSATQPPRRRRSAPDAHAATGAGFSAAPLPSAAATASTSRPRSETTARPTSRSITRSTAGGCSIRHLRTRPYRPQTNGTAERLMRTLRNGWAVRRGYGASVERTGRP